MINKTVILYSTHYLSEDVLIEFCKIKKSCGENYDVFLSYDNCRNDFRNIASLSSSECHLLDRDDIRRLGYLTWPTSHNRSRIPLKLFPGNWDFAILDFFIKNKQYKYYWRVEYDVRFSGSWKFFFDTCSDSDADLLGTTFGRYDEDPSWKWWRSLGNAEGPLGKTDMIRGFFTMCRL
jgi:hypothetical protein